MSLRPDPLDKQGPDDFPYVVTGSLGAILALFGGYMLRSVLRGDRFYGNIGRTMDFTERLGLAAAILGAGLALFAITVWGLHRNKRKGRAPRP